MNKEQAVTYLKFSGFSDEQIKAIEGAFTCEDAISREAVIDSIHANCVYENEYNLTAKHIEDAVKQLPPVNPQKPKSEWQHDHEILKAYSDGANEVLDKIKNEIEQTEINGHIRDVECFRAGIDVALNVIDKYRTERGDKE